MAKATKRSRPGRRLERKSEAWFPPPPPGALDGARAGRLGAGGAADFPPTPGLWILDGTNGFRLTGVAAGDLSGSAVSGAGDVNGDGLTDLLIGARRQPQRQMVRGELCDLRAEHRPEPLPGQRQPL